MNFEIKMWEEIESDFADGTLLLGNGASIAVSGRFAYSSLMEHAKEHGLMDYNVKKLFSFFKTDDFELVLRLVWQSTNINLALQIEDDKTRDTYIHVRDCLIKAVRNIHPEYKDVSDQLPKIYKFIKKFKTVLSLNYDLILYWAVMHGQSVNDMHGVKDCFIFGEFDEDWRRFREPYLYENKTTLVFYPHGSLVLCRNIVESEFKITSSYHLLESILSEWGFEEVVPLFVSEGTVEQKIKSIKNSNYLNTIYREVLASISTKLVIYGWNIGEQDMHILDRVRHSVVKEVAISVYGGNQGYCNRVEQIIRDRLRSDIIIKFFDSQSPNCWNNKSHNR
ncbi:DUF4917 family protein [Providencia rettgeri]|nr:DUF4917 family protein [Providencia rettgeri]